MSTEFTMDDTTLSQSIDRTRKVLKVEQDAANRRNRRQMVKMTLLAKLLPKPAKKSKAQLRREAAGESQGEPVRSRSIQGVAAAAIVQQGFAQEANLDRPQSRKLCTNLKKLRHRLRHPELHPGAKWGRPASQLHIVTR